MVTKREIVKEIFNLTDSQEAAQKLRHSYNYHKFLGLDFNYNHLKYAMAIDLNKFKKIEYISLLDEVKSALARI